MKVLQKGKITIPLEIRERLGIKDGDTLSLEAKDGSLMLLPEHTIRNPTRAITGLAEGTTLREAEHQPGKAAAMRLERKLARSIH